MFLSVQISYYPLGGEIKEPVRQVIRQLENSGLDVQPDAMSTRVYGDHDQVMQVVSDTMKWSFEHHGKAVFVAHFYQGDRRAGG